MGVVGDEIRRILRRWWFPRRAVRTLSQKGEDAASRFLQRRGHTIVARGRRVGFGELDIVAVKDRTVVFVEVKTRRSHDTGHPAEAVDGKKQHRLTRAALTYLRLNGLLEYPAQFDVIAVTWPKSQRQPTIEHFPAAFEAAGPPSMFS